MARLFELVVGGACDDFRLDERQRLVINDRSERTRRINIASYRSDILRIDRLRSVSLFGPLYRFLVDIGHDQFRAFFL
ncbi:hypothetical protein D3C71_1552120 [compost metagenome]